MHLVACYQLRANDHDRALLATAQARWHAAFSAALDLARADWERRRGKATPRPAGAPARHLRECLVVWTSRDGKTTRIVVNSRDANLLAKQWARQAPLDLHSSFRANLEMALNATLASWLGLRAAWLNSDRSAPAPGFPTLPPGSLRLATARWETALDATAFHLTGEEEDYWRAEVTRAARLKRLPISYYSAGAGYNTSGHCGLIQRSDGRLFALLYLWPKGDARGDTPQRARNRQQRGPLATLREAEDGGQPFRPGGKATVLVPLEFHRGHESLFHRRAVPKSAELVARDGCYYLHVAFQFPDHPGRELVAGRVLAVARGIDQLLTWWCQDADGTPRGCGILDGGELARLVRYRILVRAARQARGKVLRGDRRQARVVEHHCCSAGRHLRDVACRLRPERIILLDESDAQARRTGLLPWRHYTEIVERLGLYFSEAGLPDPEERKLYGSFATCPHCGAVPADRKAGTCPGCGRERDEFRAAHLLAWDTLRLAQAGAGTALGAWIAARR